METNTQPFALTPEQCEMIQKACAEYHGQLDDLYQAIGLIVAGQLFGWRVMRLVSTRSNWQKAQELFGDPKKLMDPRGPYAHRSLGLKIADELGEFWEIVRGLTKIPHQTRRTLIDTGCR